MVSGEFVILRRKNTDMLHTTIYRRNKIIFPDGFGMERSSINNIYHLQQNKEMLIAGNIIIFRKKLGKKPRYTKNFFEAVNKNGRFCETLEKDVIPVLLKLKGYKKIALQLKNYLLAGKV
jgi:hypothetical protein